MSDIDKFYSSAHEKILAGAMQPVFAFLPREFIEKCCRNAKYSWRVRRLCPIVTLLACIRKQILPGTSARDIEDWLASFTGVTDQTREGNDFCAARARLPEPIFSQACEHVGAAASKASARIWHGLRIYLVDGTTCRAPRTADNSKIFGHGLSGLGKSVLPIVRWVLLVCAGSGAVLRQQIGAYATGEQRLFYALLSSLSAGGLVIGDGGYNSFLTLWKIQARGCHALCSADPTRRPEFVRHLGYQDELQRWHRPDRSATAFPEFISQAPETMLVRVIRRSVRRKGYRTWTLEICTTLLEAQKYPANELAELYLQRWLIEDDIRALKDTLDLRRLTAKTAAIVRKEILSGILAYNVVRAIESQTQNKPRELSFERARTLLVEFCIRMSDAITTQLPQLFKLLIELIGGATIDRQIRLPEPRAIIQHPTCYLILQMSRKAWREKNHAAS